MFSDSDVGKKLQQQMPSEEVSEQGLVHRHLSKLFGKGCNFSALNRSGTVQMVVCGVASVCFGHKKLKLSTCL